MQDQRMAELARLVRSLRNTGPYRMAVGLRRAWSDIRDAIGAPAWILLHYLCLAVCATMFVAALRYALGSDAWRFTPTFSWGPELTLFQRQRYVDWLRPYINPEHRFTFVGIAVGGTMVAAALLAAQSLLVRPKFYQRTIQRLPWCFASALVLFVACFFMLASASFRIHTLAAAMLGWGIVWAAPFLPAPQVMIRWTNTSAIGAALLTVVVAVFLLTTSPFVLGMVPVPLEYFEIPTTTYIRGKPGAAERPVDTIQFINNNRLFGNQLLYDPRIAPGQDPPCLEGNSLGSLPAPLIKRLQQGARSQFYAHNSTGESCFIGLIDSDTILRLQDAPGATKEHLLEVYAKNGLIFKGFDVSEYTPEMQEFADKNILGLLHVASDLEKTFHHHFQILNPMKEYGLGRAPSEIQSLYGLGYIPLYHLLEATGGVTYQRYLSAVFTSYWLYCFAFAAVVYYITRRFDMTAAATAFLCGATEALGVIPLFIAVGYTPMRHMLDVAIIGALFAYLYSSERCRGTSALSPNASFTGEAPTAPAPAWGWLAVACIAAVLGIWIDRMMGIFGLMALVATLGIRVIAGHSRFKPEVIAICALTILGGLSMAATAMLSAKHPYVIYLADGLWGFDIPFIYLVGFPALSVLLYGMVIISMQAKPDDRKYIVIFTIVYALTSALYYVVLPERGHLLAMVPVVGLITVLLVTLLPWSQLTRVFAQYAQLCVLAVGVGFALLSSLTLLGEGMSYHRYVKAHELYAWPERSMGISTVMDPTLFNEASQLIERNSRDGEKVYILSEYDVLLTYLANRITAMPHYDMTAYLLLYSRFNDTVEELVAAKPETLFVDTCISCSWRGMVPTRPFPGFDTKFLLERALDKSYRLRLLNTIFERIEEDYELKEKGPLISVYTRRKAG